MAVGILGFIHLFTGVDPSRDTTPLICNIFETDNEIWEFVKPP
jgi:hypothetical protein